MNYFKSEKYRIIRTKGLYVTAGISLGLVIAGILALYFSLQADPNFTYGTNRFLYLNVITVFPLISLIGLLISKQLLGSDITIVKQSVSFGISRNRIFFSKLLLTLIEFLLLCLLGILIVLIGGENFLTADPIWKSQFLISVFNLIPLIIAAFTVGYTLMISIKNEVVSVLITLFLFNGLLSKLINFVELKLWRHSVLSTFLPGSLIEQNTNSYVLKNATIAMENWVIGLIIIIVTLGFGISIYNKKNL